MREDGFIGVFGSPRHWGQVSGTYVSELVVKFKLVYYSPDSISGDKIEYYIFDDPKQYFKKYDYMLTLHDYNRKKYPNASDNWNHTRRTVFRNVKTTFPLHRLDRLYIYKDKNVHDYNCDNIARDGCHIAMMFSRYFSQGSTSYRYMDKNYFYIKRNGAVKLDRFRSTAHIITYQFGIKANKICMIEGRRYSKIGSVYKYDTPYQLRNNSWIDGNIQSTINDEHLCLFNTKAISAVNTKTKENVKFFFHLDYQLLIVCLQKSGSRVEHLSSDTKTTEQSSFDNYFMLLRYDHKNTRWYGVFFGPFDHGKVSGLI